MAHPWYLLGRLLHENGQSADALGPLARAVTIEPTLEDGHYQLGLALMSTGHGADAVRAFMIGLAAHAQLARRAGEARVGAGDAPGRETPPRRRRDLPRQPRQRADQIDPPEILDALAAALAEQKQFDDAADDRERSRPARPQVRRRQTRRSK